MTLLSPRLQRALSGMYNFNFGQYFSDGFNLVFRNAGPVIGFMLVWGLIYLATQFLPLVGPFAYGLVIGPCLLAGFYFGMDKSYRGENLEFGVFFQGFDKIGHLVLMTLIQSVLILASLIPFIIAAVVMGVMSYEPGGSADDLIVLVPVLFLLILPAIYLGTAWSFSSLFVIFYDMEAWQAMETSRKVISAKWFPFFGLMFVGGLVAMAGMLALGIGMLITIPAYLAMTYAAFRDIVGMPEETEEDVTLAPLVD